MRAGLANDKAVSVTAAEGGGVTFTKKNKSGKFSSSTYKKKGSKAIADAIGKEVASYRPDLKAKAMAASTSASGASSRDGMVAESSTRGGGGVGRTAAPAVGGDDDSDDDDMPALA